MSTRRLALPLASSLHHIAAALSRFPVRLVHYAALARSRRSLSRLDDHLLRDIGLTRSDVTSALSSRAGEDPSVRLAATRSDRRAARRPAEGAGPAPVPRSPGMAHYIGVGAKRSL